MRTQLHELVVEMVRKGIPLDMAMREFERAYLRHVVAAHDGNHSAAARDLGIHRNTLRRWLQAGKIKVKFRRIDNRKVFEGSEIKKVWRIAL